MFDNIMAADKANQITSEKAIEEIQWIINNLDHENLISLLGCARGVYKRMNSNT